MHCPTACAIWLLLLGAAFTDSAQGDGLVFERDVRPILRAHCLHCHGEEGSPKGGLDLRFVQGMLRGGDAGPALERGNRAESYLWDRVLADEMPPGDKKMSAAEKETLGRWIDAGAPTVRPEPETLPPPGLVMTEEEQSHWSFRPVSRPDVPAVVEEERVRTPIDAFLLARLEARGESFGPEASRETLIRRLSFDLIGLPPGPEEVEAFVADRAPDAYERLVDRLLASPRYGERWARHWLDVAGYADSDGYTATDQVRPYAYKYRDYLIRALNDDRPWDELLVEQLAGDELAGTVQGEPSPDQVERLTATGFLRMAPDGTADGEVDQTIARNDVLAETIKVVSTSLLGLTVGCAQCHAHRYDPISHEDYYRFRAIFEPALDPKAWRKPSERLVSLWTSTDREKAAEADAEVKRLETDRQKEIDELVARVLEKELESCPEELRTPLRMARDTEPNNRTAEQKQLLKTYPRVLVASHNVSLYDGKAHGEIMKKYEQPLAEARGKRPAEDFLAVLNEVPGQVPETRLFVRGDPNQPAQAVAPGELSVLASATGTSDLPSDDPTLPTTGRRLAYARHLTSGRHPLTARVLVNRVWMHHFGRGLVPTPGDFGALGERPSHPELLDWIADEFVVGGWQLKRLHRLIVLSTAYRQSSVRRDHLDSIDPENKLLGRMNIRRLEAEAVRDAILFVSGGLSGSMYGPPAPVAVDLSGQVIIGNEGRDGNGNPTARRGQLAQEELRRSFYVQARRSMPLGELEPFDLPMMSPNCERRNSSTSATQSLLLMNNEFVTARALAMAERLEQESGPELADRVRRAWGLAFGTSATTEQIGEAVAFISSQQADFERTSHERKNGPTPSRAALALFCQALLGANGFLYVD